jgi:hypothetical protein
MFMQMGVGFPVLLTPYSRSSTMRGRKVRFPAGLGTDCTHGNEQFKILAAACGALRGR